MSKRTFLITGAAGFFGSHLVEHLMKNTNDNLVLVDNLNYSGTLDRLRDIKLDDPALPETLITMSPLESPRVKFFNWDFRLEAEPNFIRELTAVTHVIHAGGMTHVDSSITDPMSYVVGNVVGTTNVLELARKLPNLTLFHYCNTDEVFGAAPPLAGEPYDKDYGDGAIVERTPLFLGFHEGAAHKPGNPYSASKSAGFQMVQAYANTYQLRCISTNLMNLIGERQHHEKFVPKVIRSIIKGDKVFIHANPERTKAGQRTYIHCRNAAAAFLFLYDKEHYRGTDIRSVETYNIVGEKEVDNLAMARFIEKYVHASFGMMEPKLKYELVDFHSSRPGHDLRYALDGLKMKSLGWAPPATLEASLKKTVQWYLANNSWLNLEGK